MAQDVFKGELGRLSVSLAPHVLVEVQRQHGLGCANHVFEAAFDGAPIRFIVLCAHTSRRALEIPAVVHCLVCVAERRKLPVRCPLVGTR